MTLLRVNQIENINSGAIDAVRGLRVNSLSYIYSGDGSPEDVQTAPPGSLYLDYTNGILYVKSSGTGASGWGTYSFSNLTTAGFIKNTALGVISGGNAILATDLPNNIDATKIGSGNVSNTNFDYLQNVTDLLISRSDKAVQADQETGTSGTKYVSPAYQHYHQSAAKAWVHVNGTVNPITYTGYNISSITDVGTGDYVIRFTVPFSSALYAYALGVEEAGSTSTIIYVNNSAQYADQIQIYTRKRSDDSSIDTKFSAVFYGDQ